jgi:hypothetical protein
MPREGVRAEECLGVGAPDPDRTDGVVVRMAEFSPPELEMEGVLVSEAR